MITYLKNLRRALRSALWSRPLAYSVVAVLLALAISASDQALPQAITAWLPQSHAASVESLLRLLAGSMLTIVTVTLSVLMLIFNLASAQASPRALPELMADPVIKNALATFFAVFVFALVGLALFAFDAIQPVGTAIYFAVAFVLAFVALRYLLHLIHHGASSLKINRTIHRIYGETAEQLDRYFEIDPALTRPSAQPEPEGGQRLTLRETGYIQLIDSTRLDRLAERHDLSVALAVREGSFVHPELPVMTVGGPDGTDPDLQDRLRSTIVTGHERSMVGDPELGLTLLAEIADRSLSPGVNDPATALICLDYIGSLLVRAAGTAPAQFKNRVGPNGRVRYRRVTFEDMVNSALASPARHGAGNAAIACKILAILGQAADGAAPAHRPALQSMAETVAERARTALTLQSDIDRITATMPQ